MGKIRTTNRFTERASGKWQIPLFVISAGWLGIVFFYPASPVSNLSRAQLLEELDRLVLEAKYESAIRAGEKLLVIADGTANERGRVHARLGRARFELASQQGIRSAEQGRRIAGHFEQARKVEYPLEADDWVRLGGANEWLGDYLSALPAYRTAIDLIPRGRGPLRRHLFELMRNRTEAPAEELERLLNDAITDSDGDPMDTRVWFLEQTVEILLDQGRTDEASALMAKQSDAFAGTEGADRVTYLGATVLFHGKQWEAAERELRHLRQHLQPWTDLHAMSGWLLGRILAECGQPERLEEAQSFFLDVLTVHPGHPYAVASRVALGKVQAQVGRHDDAIASFNQAVHELQTQKDRGPVEGDALRAMLAVLAETQRVHDRLEPALGYLRPAALLIGSGTEEQDKMIQRQLAQVLRLRAAELHGRPESVGDALELGKDVPEAARALYTEAAETYLRLAKLDTHDERRSSEASWTAAELLMKAGDLPRAARLFEAFAEERPSDRLVPRAVLTLGRLKQFMNDFAGAIRVFEECRVRFARTLEGTHCLVPLAQCYARQGGASLNKAEATLKVVLEDSEVVTPDAPEFADALFLMGDVLKRKGDEERAIAVLHEALDRFPGDGRVREARFLLADAYRKSALGMRRELVEGRISAEPGSVRMEVRNRLHAAGSVYRQVVDDYESYPPDELNKGDQVRLRLSRLYEADCFFEAQDYPSAVRRYEAALGLLAEPADVLAAYVQIINCHVFLGQPAEARAALARALVLVDSSAAERFGNDLSPQTQADWKRYLEWLNASELF